MLKRLLLLLVMLPCLLAADVLTAPCSIPPELDYFLNCFLEAQRSKGLIPVTKNAEGECEIEKISLLFDYFGVLDIPSARRLIVDVVISLLQKLNTQEKLYKYFACPPLTVDNLDIRIRIRTDHCGFVYPKLGNIAYVTAIDGIISYSTLNSYTYEINNLRMEPFSKALQFSSQ